MLANTGLYIDEVALWASRNIADWPFHFSSSNCLALNATRPPTSQMPMEDLMHWNKSSMCKWYVIHPEEIICSEAQHIHIINKKQLHYIASSVFVASCFKLGVSFNNAISPHEVSMLDKLQILFIPSSSEARDWSTCMAACHAWWLSINEGR